MQTAGVLTHANAPCLQTESLLELDHQILPLDAQNQEGAAQRPGDGGKEGTGGEGSNGSTAKEGGNGSAAQAVKQVEKIFEQTAAEVCVCVCVVGGGTWVWWLKKSSGPTRHKLWPDALSYSTMPADTC